MTDQELNDIVVGVVRALKPEDFNFTVTIPEYGKNGIWDIYKFKTDTGLGTIAVRIHEGQVEVGLFSPKELSISATMDEIRKSMKRVDNLVMSKFDDDEVRESHPSYVLVSFSKRSGNPGRMFGSSIENHQSYITLKVSKGIRIFNGRYDRYYSSIDGDILEINFTAAQFAELLTTMNVAMGVPGTLSHFQRQKVESPPESPLEAAKVRSSFKDQMKDLVSSCKKKAARVAELSAQKALSVKEKGELLDMVRNLTMEVESNVPYMLTCLEEAAEKTITHAKAEVDAFVTHSIFAEGLKLLMSKTEPDVPQLPESTEDKQEDLHMELSELKKLKPGQELFWKGDNIYPPRKVTFLLVHPNGDGVWVDYPGAAAIVGDDGNDEIEVLSEELSSVP